MTRPHNLARQRSGNRDGTLQCCLGGLLDCLDEAGDHGWRLKRLNSGEGVRLRIRRRLSSILL